MSLGDDQDYFDEEEENTARIDAENRQNTTKPSTVPNVPMRKVNKERKNGYRRKNWIGTLDSGINIGLRLLIFEKKLKKKIWRKKNWKMTAMPRLT